MLLPEGKLNLIELNTLLIMVELKWFWNVETFTKNHSRNNCNRLPQLRNHNVVRVVQQEFVFLFLIPPVGIHVRS